MTDVNIEWPNPPIPEVIRALVTEFYRVADSRAEDAPRRLGTEMFASAGQIVTNRRKISGVEDIINAHESLWGTVKSRVHHIHKVYSAGPDGGDLMVFGVVEWTFNDEKVVDGTFVSRFIIEAGGSNGPRVKLFQAWADKKDV